MAEATETMEAPDTTTAETAHAATTPTTCARCQRSLTWRDRVYVGAVAVLCKACHARNTRRQIRGYPIPPSALPKPPEQHGAARTKALTARPRLRGCRETDPRGADQHPPQRWQAQSAQSPKSRRKATA